MLAISYTCILPSEELVVRLVMFHIPVVTMYGGIFFSLICE